MSIAEPHGSGSARGDLADRILEAARRLVLRTGARKLSLSDVATLAGVSRPTIYRYFASKEDLIDALGTHERRRFDAAMERAMSGVTGIARLEAAVDVIATFVEAQPPGVFDDAAKKAVLKFKYKPRVEGGKPVAVPNVQHLIAFKIEKGKRP